MIASNCLFLLSGVDPVANAQDWSKVCYNQTQLSEGRYEIMPEAEVLRVVILDGWTGGAARRALREIQEVVEGIIGTSDEAELHFPAPKDSRALQAIYTQWLDEATLDSRWLTKGQYRAEWRNIGYDIEEEI